MAQVLPRGYSANSFPRYRTSPTHRIIGPSIPVYTTFPQSNENYSPTLNSDIFYKFLQQDDQIVVLDDSLGYEGNWVEVMILGDQTTSENNYFIYNSPTFPVIEREPGILPSPPTSENYISRDYSQPIFSYESRAENIPFFDNVYQHYVVKSSYTLEQNTTLDFALEKILLKGVESLSDNFPISLPSMTLEYLTNTYEDYFRVIDYKLEVRGDSDTNLSKLVGYVTIKSKYFDHLLPELFPTTENIAAEEPQYRRSAFLNGQATRVNEYVDAWLDPYRSPVEAENFLRQYSENFLKQIESDFDFKKSFSDIGSRGSRTPLNIIDIMSEEMSETPIIGRRWLDNQSNQARSEAGVAKQDLERAIGDAIDSLFTELGLSPVKTRAARAELQKFTAAVVAVGGTIEDVNDMISSTASALNSSPEIVSVFGEGTADNIEIDLLQAFTAALDPDANIADIIKDAAEFPNDLAIHTIEQSNEIYSEFSYFFDEDLGTDSSLVREKYPLTPHPTDTDLNLLSSVYLHDSKFTFSKRKQALDEIERVYTNALAAGKDSLEDTSIVSEYNSLLESFVENFYGTEFDNRNTTTEDTTYRSFKNCWDIFQETSLTTQYLRLTPSPALADSFLGGDIENINRSLDVLDNTYEIGKGYILFDDKDNIYKLASKIAYQSSVRIPSFEVTKFDHVISKPFSYGHDSLWLFYDNVKECLLEHGNSDWSYSNVGEEKLLRYSKEIDSFVENALSSLVPLYASTAGKNDRVSILPPDGIIGPRLTIGYDKDFKPIYIHLSAKIGQESYNVFAFSGAKDKKYDTDTILNTQLSRDAAFHLFKASELNDTIQKLGTKKISQSWRDFVINNFPFSEITFKSPSEKSSLANEMKRTYKQNTRGRTLSQSRDQIRTISQLAGDTSVQTEDKVRQFEDNPSSAQYVVDSAAEIVIDGQATIFNAVDSIGTSDELFEKFINQLPYDIPAIKPLVQCLIPSIDFEKLLEDTEYYKIIKDTLDSIMATVETAGAALNVYETLEAALTPPEGAGDDYLTQAFTAALEKAINLLILEAFKRALEYVQVLCLKWQAFLMEMIASALFGSADAEALPPGTEAGAALPGTVGTSSTMGNQVVFSLSRVGFSEDELKILSSPVAFRYLEDLSTLLSPPEFCQLLTNRQAPGYLKDVAFGLYETNYLDTILGELENENRLLQFLFIMGEQIDPQLCEALSSLSRLPSRGYSHTVRFCDDTSDIERLREDILLENSSITQEEARQILDNEKKKDADTFKDILVKIEAESTGGKDSFDASQIFEELPEVKNERRHIHNIENIGLINAITLDAYDYYTAIGLSGKEEAQDAVDDVELGPLGDTYQKFAQAKTKYRLKQAFPSLTETNYPSELEGPLRRILWKNSTTGEYAHELKDLADELTELTGILFQEDDIETIRIAAPKVILRELSATSLGQSGDSLISNLDEEPQRTVFDNEVNKYLGNLKAEIDSYTDEEIENIVEVFRIHNWKPYIGVYDVHNNYNLYYTSGDKPVIEPYMSSNYSTAYPMSYSGASIEPTDYVGKDTIYYWLRAETIRQANEFYIQFTEEEGTCEIKRVFIGTRWPANTNNPTPPPLLSFEQLSIVEEISESESTEDPRQIYEDATYDGLVSNTDHVVIKGNQKLIKDARDILGKDAFTSYIENGTRYIGGKIRSVSSESVFTQEMSPTQDGALENEFKKKIRDATYDLGELLFEPSVPFAHRERTLTHLMLKQGYWSESHFDTDEKYGMQMFDVLSKVKKNLTKETNKSALLNDFPDIVRENFLGIFYIEKIFSQKEQLKKKFKSPIKSVDEASISSERRDYNIEEKVSLWISMNVFVRTFVSDYVLKMLPMIMSSNFFSEEQKKVSQKIIMANLETFLREDRGQEFEVFKKKLLYISNALWLFLKQQPCSETDLSSYKGPMSAIEDFIKEGLEDAQQYLEEEGLLNSLKEKQSTSSPVIEVYNTSENLSSRLQDNPQNILESKEYNVMAKYIGESSHGISLEYLESRPDTISPFNNVCYTLDNSGLFYIDNRVVKKVKNQDGTIVTELYGGLDEFDVEFDPETIINETISGNANIKYYVTSRLNLLKPLNFSNHQWPKKIHEPLEKDTLKGQERIILLDEIEFPEPFYDSFNPFGNGTSLIDSDVNMSREYLDNIEDRLKSTIKLSNEQLALRKTYKQIIDVLNSLQTSRENYILKGMMYYSLYEYYDKMSSEECFRITRTKAIDMFLKADARGTTLSDFVLNAPVMKKDSGIFQSTENTFYQHYSSILSGDTIEGVFDNTSSARNTTNGIPYVNDQPADMTLSEFASGSLHQAALAFQTTSVKFNEDYDDEDQVITSIEQKGLVVEMFMRKLEDAIDSMSMLERRVYIRENAGKKWAIRIAMRDNFDDRHVVAHTVGDSQFASQAMPMLAPPEYIEIAPANLAVHNTSRRLPALHYDEINAYLGLYTGPLPQPLYTSQKTIPSMHEEEFKEWILTESRRQIELTWICFRAYFSTPDSGWASTKNEVEAIAADMYWGDWNFMLTNMIISTKPPE